VATSSGRHTGRAVKIASISQSPDLQDGDVIVVPYSDVAWTPLFSRAGAIVAESGGFLSHTSIVAREYGIPAVVSVSSAMHAIPQGALVEVDGFTGIVAVLSAQGDRESETPEEEVPG
jgi:phosphohistidine swiveling domain-containing protein